MRTAKLLKKSLFALLSFFILLTISTIVVIKTSGDKNFVPKKDPTLLNDITGLNPIRVDRVITPTQLNEIISAIKHSTGQISIGGGKFSQGGQTAAAHTLHIDMRKFNQVLNIDIPNKQITVQPGITWRTLQTELDKHNLSVKIMQTYANFTVGGSISVNVHGRYIGEGPLVRSIQSIKLVLADGSLITASRNINSDIFSAAIGGYGGIGVIVEATLILTDDIKIERVVTKMHIEDYTQFFTKQIRNNSNIVMHNGDIYPPEYRYINSVSWQKTEKPLTNNDRLITENATYHLLPWLAKISAEYAWGKWAREHLIEPYYYSEPRVVWRNWEASYNVSELQKNISTETAYGLREYFVPVARFNDFIPRMRDIFLQNNANIINVSIRHALPDTTTLLAWAPQEVFAFVVYYQQGTDEKARREVGIWTTAMNDAAISLGGSYYLPYQNYASYEQFQQAYPKAVQYFDIKKRVDPNNRFTNSLWNRYNPSNTNAITQSIKSNKNYIRPEEQTYLSIPEWYLVFNPVEYSTYLDANNNPSDFPFMASINEYWSLYDKVTAIAHSNYAHNNDYMLMLNVIGISTTVEYLLKAAYENSIGRFTRWTASNETDEEKIMRDAYRAYSHFIYDKAWYEFAFWPRVKLIWSEPDFFAHNFIRKTERKMFFTLEFGFKALYAELIAYASKNTFEPSSGKVFLTIKANTASKPLPAEATLIKQENDTLIITLPRWQGFTKSLPKVINAGYTVIDISNNPMILISILLPKDTPASPQLNLWFSSNVVSNTQLQRWFIATPVDELKATLEQLPNLHASLEHIYDF